MKKVTRKSGTLKDKGKGTSSSWNDWKLISILLVIVCVIASVSVLLILRSKTADDQLTKLVGQWIRTDGGYILDIREVMPSGEVDIAYYNPRPINVSQAKVTKKQKMLHLFIELRDVGYPGATYELTYVEQHEALVGVYFQPTINQQFEVVFVRME